MTTVVAGRRARVVRSDSFVSITDAEVIDISGDCVTFDADLDEETVAAVRDLMTSGDDVDQAARADLRLKRDAVLGDDPIAQAVRAAINYLLGETS